MFNSSEEEDSLREGEGVRWSGQGVRGCKAGKSWCWREAETARDGVDGRGVGSGKDIKR